MWVHGWLYLYLNIFSALISAEVITLINGDNITCVLTEEDVYSALYIWPVESDITIKRDQTAELNDWDVDDWTNYNSTELDYPPISDIGWNSFKIPSNLPLRLNNTFFFCHKDPVNVTIQSKNFEKNGGLNLSHYKTNNNFCEWYYLAINISKNSSFVKPISGQDLERTEINEINFEAKWILFSSDTYVKINKYAIKYSNNITTEKKSSIKLPQSSNRCISLFVSVDEDCYLNITLNSNITQIKGFNKKDMKYWKQIEITSDKVKSSGMLSFHRGRYDNKTTGYWAVSNIKTCRPKPEVVKTTITSQNRTNGNDRYLCKTLNPSKSPKFCDQEGLIGSSCAVNCSEALGDFYKSCQNHKICLEDGTCSCALGYKGPSCNKTCEGNEWGLNCSKNCNAINCKTCDINGCTKCQSRYLYNNNNCIEKLPVVFEAPRLLSIRENSLKISLNLTYNKKNEATPQFYQIQYKQTNENYFKTKPKSFFDNIEESYVIEDVDTTRWEYQIRVILLTKNNQSFMENIPELRTFKKSLNMSANKDLTLLWDPYRNMIGYVLKYEGTQGFCSNSTKKDNFIETNNTSATISNITNYLFINVKLFGLEKESNKTQLLDEITYKRRDSCGNKTLEGTSVVTVVAVTAVLFVVALVLALIYYNYIPLKFFRRQNRHRNRSMFFVARKNIKSESFELHELTPMITQNAEKDCSIRINEFEDYLFKNLEDNPDDNEITRQYQAIRVPLKEQLCARKAENARKNRYTSILPYDETRVILRESEGGNDYINANFIDGYETPKAFIAAQAPIPSTVEDFWQMICEQNVSVVIMLTELRENGLIKCEQYWPDFQSRCRFGKISLENISTKTYPHYIRRELKIHYCSKIYFVQHLQYVTWPDHGVPLCRQSFTSFLKEITEIPQTSPMVVHCSAGCGRTGTFILCDIAIKMAKKENEVNFFKLLRRMREQRPLVVTNVDQYIFAHFVILDYFCGKDFSIPTTANFKNEVQIAIQEDALNNLAGQVDKALKQYLRTKFKLNYQLTDDEKAKNRFSDILPGHSQIFLSVSSQNSSNYINAVSVDCYLYPKKFIVTQQPLPNTLKDFWRLIVEYEINTIVSLNEIEEDDKCPRFWPNKRQDVRVYDNLKISLLGKTTRQNVFQVIRVKITDNNDSEKKIVTVINMKGWKRETLQPDSLNKLILVWKEMISDSGKIVVTCYDGATASGLFTALAYLLEKINMDHRCDVFTAVKTVKQNRVQFLQNLEQIKFLYQVALEYVEEFNTYGNFVD
ncbi:uncharacterized protein LOC123010780 isoform X2 [Tribolium madens]|uniref:uncharacterized protein LOC123010780 isoform X2 n=1 Tax=Tribolium madens TaxID=41895 RepID=UPI001CF76209|nr:uncharacterized protein LOC123010780 isoform X2 [Tribolium madens]